MYMYISQLFQLLEKVEQKKMKGAFILLLSFVIQLTIACPFYIIPSLRVNYTNFTTACPAAVHYGVPVHVCDGAVISTNEIACGITGIFTLVGDQTTSSTEQLPILIIDSIYNTPAVFQLTGAAQMFVQTLQITSNGTIFSVTGSSLLTMYQCNLYLADVGIYVSTGTTAGMGFQGTFVNFIDMGVDIVDNSGPVACSGCRFFDPRTAAVTVPSTSILVVGLLQIVNSVWINENIMIAVQSNPSVVPTAYPLPSNWGIINNNINVITYQQDCVTPSPSPVIGIGISSGCPACDCKTSTFGGPSIWQIIMLIIVASAFMGVMVIRANSVAQKQL